MLAKAFLVMALAAAVVAPVAGGNEADRPKDVVAKEGVGMAVKALAGNRCRIEASWRFEASARYTYRARIRLQYRLPGSSANHTVKTGRKVSRGKPDTNGTGFGRVRTAVDLDSPRIADLVERGATFRSVNEQRVRVKGHKTRRDTVWQTLRMKQCELGIPSKHRAG